MRVLTKLMGRPDGGAFDQSCDAVSRSVPQGLAEMNPLITYSSAHDSIATIPACATTRPCCQHDRQIESSEQYCHLSIPSTEGLFRHLQAPQRRPARLKLRYNKSTRPANGGNGPAESRPPGRSGILGLAIS